MLHANNEEDKKGGARSEIRGVVTRVTPMLRIFARRYTSISPARVLGSLKDRGLIINCTNVSVDAIHSDQPSVYVGFDPTADSLHVGNLVTIMGLIHFQRAGYQPLAVVGGATGIIGDPSGRAKERQVLPQEELIKNVTGISETLSRILKNSTNLSSCQANGDLPLLPVKILNNADWYKGMSVIDFMSNIGRHFRLGSMLNKESVHQRINSQEGMSFTEFSYQVFQSYDFMYLSENHNCWLQLGGGDQWGNISAGCEFVHKHSGRIVHGITMPLVTSSTGEKLGKSAGNAVWLSPEKTSPYHLYQYFFNTTDEDVERFLKYFTFISTSDIAEILREHRALPENRTAQIHLASNVTRLVHGEEGLLRSQNAAAALFGETELLTKMKASDIEQLLQDAPSTTLPRSLLDSNFLTVVELVVEAGAVPSRNQARRLIQSGGLYINNQRVESVNDVILQVNHVIDGCITVVRTGKKRHFLIKWK